MAINLVAAGNSYIHDGEGGTNVRPILLDNELGSNLPYHAQPFEQNPDLFPRIQALRTYEQMKQTDVEIRNSLRICKFPVLSGEWHVEPASDSDLDKEVAEFVEYNLFENLTTPWQQVLNHVLTKLDYGFSVLEEVFEQKQWRKAASNSNSKPMAMLRKLAIRPALGVDEFLYDEYGGPDGINFCNYYSDQYGVRRSEESVFIPIEKLLVFTNELDGADLFGQSILRPAYPHWYFKQHLYKIDAIQKERHGIGIPEIGLPPGYDDADLQFAAQLARNMRTNEHGFVLRPPGWEVGFAKPEGQLTNALESAAHHNLMISLNVLMQFIDPGMHESRANAATAFDLLLKSLRQEGILVCEGFNQHCIPQLVDLNYKVSRYPHLGVRGIGQARDQQMIAAAIRNLVQVNALSIDDSTEVEIRKIFDLPPSWDKTDDRVNEMLIKPFATPSGIPPAPGNGQPANAGLAAAAAKQGVSGKPPASPGRGPAGGNQPKATTEG